MIAACVPSRGLMHSQTIDDILKSLKPYPHEVIFSHCRPVPEAYNEAVGKALKLKPEFIWLVDDDMLIPPGLLDEMIALKADIAIADYPVFTDGHVVQFIKGRFAFSGIGCTLVKPKVFKKLGKPYFRIDYSYLFPSLEPTRYVKGREAHGLHDIDFFIRARDLPGIEIKIAERCAGQYNVVGQLKEPGNDKALKIEEWRLKEPNSLKYPQPY